jgi:hypothetical protein
MMVIKTSKLGSAFGAMVTEAKTRQKQAKNKRVGAHPAQWLLGLAFKLDRAQ